MRQLNARVSRFAKVTRPPSTPVSLKSILAEVRTDRWRKQIEEIRAERDADARKALKRELPAVTFSARCAGGHREENVKNHSGLLCIDFDDLPNAEETKQEIKDDEHVLVAFISPSGTGLKVLVPIDATKGTHEKAFRAAAEYFKLQYALTADETCKNVTRLCFLSHDPKVYVRDRDAEPFGFSDADNPVAEREEAQEDALLYLQGPDPDITLADARRLLKRVDPDVSYGEWLKVAAALRHQFPSGEEAEQAYELFDEWSSRGEKYESEKETRAKWRSLKPNTNDREPVTIGTLKKMAAQDEKASLTSFQPIDLSAVVDGNFSQPKPEVLQRDDFECLFYRGVLNGIHGDSGTGKGWVICFAIKQELEAGNRVMLLDLEAV